MEKLIEPARKLAEEFCQFLKQSYSPFHVVDICTKQLQASGFKQLKETENWQLEKGGKYLFSRNQSSLVAFIVGDQYQGQLIYIFINNKASKTGFKIVATHTDSPSLRLAPISKLSANGFNQCSIETYGGGLWHSWFDRDLILGGKVIFKNEKNELLQQLFTYHKPIMKISTLAPHLDNATGFAYNKETHLRPIISTEIYDKLLSPSSEEIKEKEENQKGIKSKHYSKLLDLISKQTKIPIEQILDFDLRLTNSQQPQIMGINDEFISSDKMDNLISTFSALQAFTSQNYQPTHEFIDMIVLLDHEEIGSCSAQGAASPLVKETIQRIFKIMGGEEKIDDFEKAIHRSYVISNDVGHSINPNYTSKHQQNHESKLNSGLIVSISAIQDMATDAVSLSILRTIAEQANIPLQEAISRQDQRSGMTLGPILSSQTSIKTVDMGTPQLGMHSTSETTGVLDLLYCRDLIIEFFNKYESIKHTLFDY